ncbi:MAG: prepilin-type N-terminal cleavage/methylation domain-containing protein [Verrucomicrobia bacterium]|nr:prepilin-type N-terminal cleavage/methylation domain-containing protein [Verrucomicrobiota bacterium]
MTPPPVRPGVPRGFTLVELLVTLALIGLLAALLLPALSRATTRSRQVACIGNLRQIGIAFHVFAHEHGGQFPQQVSTNGGGALEVSRTPEPWWNVILPSVAPFLAVSNELGNLKVLQCPAVRRLAPPEASGAGRSTDFAAVAGAVWGDPTSALVLDRNVDRVRTRRSTNGLAGGSLEVVWTPERHSGRGNVLWGDGHAEGVRRASVAAVGGGAGSGGGSNPGTSGSGPGAGSTAPGGRPQGSGGGAGGQGGGPGGGGSLGASTRPSGPAGVHPSRQEAAAGAILAAPALPGVPLRNSGAEGGAEDQATLDRIQRRLQFGLLALILACMMAGLLAVLAHAWNRYRALSS